MTPAELVAVNEGVRANMYYDTKGIATIGVGFNLERLDANEILARVGANKASLLLGKPLSKDQIYALLDIELQACVRDLRTIIPGFDGYPENARAVLIDLRYNLGGAGLRKWPKTLDAFRKKDWALAAKRIEENKLWVSQVKTRAERDVKLLKDIQ